MGIREKLDNVRTYGIVHILKNKLWGVPFAFFEKLGMHVLPVHYYSPVPDTRYLRTELDRWYRESPMVGVRMNIEQQLSLLTELGVHSVRLDKLPPFDQRQNAGLGPGYGEVEAHILSAMIYHFQPESVVEVGSGLSTAYILDALDANDRGSIYSYEPYPRDALIKISNPRLQLNVKEIQNVPVNEFKLLKENDILFIDSSHVCKLGSDVEYLYLEVLPSLNKGVIVHIHDIPLPYPCPQDYESWIFKRHQFWNEPAIVHAFLCFNETFDIILSSAYLHYHHSDKMNAALPVYNKDTHFPSSLWIRKNS